MEMFELIQLILEQLARSDPIYSKLALLIKKTLEQVMSNKEKIINKLNSDEALLKEKRKTANLEKENIELTKEYEKQLRLIESHQKLIKELTKRVSDKSFIHTADVQNTKLMEEMKMLYKENSRLNSVNQKLQLEMTQLRNRENSLIKMLKGETALQGNSNTLPPEVNINNEGLDLSKKELNKTVIEQKRKRVEIPALDFSKLPERKPAKLTIIPCSSHSSSVSEAEGEKHIEPVV